MKLKTAPQQEIEKQEKREWQKKERAFMQAFPSEDAQKSGPVLGILFWNAFSREFASWKFICDRKMVGWFEVSMNGSRLKIDEIRPLWVRFWAYI